MTNDEMPNVEDPVGRKNDDIALIYHVPAMADSAIPVDAAPRVRLAGQWLLFLLVVFNALALGGIWFADHMRQSKLIHSTITVGGSALLVLFWIGFFSSLRRQMRLGIVGGVVAICLLSGAVLRIEGVSGDLVPMVTWRWVPDADKYLPREQVKLADPAEGSGTNSRTNSPPGLLDYPQFLGPHRNVKFPGVKLARDWSTRPPRLMWRQPIGAGWSAFAVAGCRAVTQEQRGQDEMVVCYDLVTGQIQWSHQDQARFDNTLAGIGPRATPTIDGDQVYTLGATGILNCLDLATGQCIWSKNILEENQAELNEWGMSGSPLLVDEMVIINAGGPDGRSLVAYDRHRGQRIWSSGHDRASYSSPLLAELVELRQIVILNQTTVAGHDLYTGQIVWEHAWPGKHPKVAQPVTLPGDRIFLSSSYGLGCMLLQIGSENGRQVARRVWKNMRLKAKFTNVAHRDGFIYGLDEGRLVCLDVETGRRLWKEGRYGHGQLILVNDMLLVQAESGEIVLVEATPEKHSELARFAAIEGRTWNNPALAGRYLLVRNDHEAACYVLAVRP